jgi:hypothetical protein
LFNQNPKEYGGLLSYLSVLERQISYNNKASYIFLIEEYLKGNAGEAKTELFVWGFFSIVKKDSKALKILEEDIKRLDTFYIDPKSTGFYSVISQICCDCEALTDSNPKYTITADQFSDSLKQIFLEIQKSLNK